MVGIISYGVYLPWRRLSRQAISEAHRWAMPGGAGKGQRTMASWDEDAVTMAVEASRRSLADLPREKISAIHLGSTTLPFADRQNAGLVAGALGLPVRLTSADFGGSLRAGSTALRSALSALQADQTGCALVTASERRRAPAMSTREGQIGDGAASVVLGNEGVIAHYLGGDTLTVDFVGHFRENGSDFDYEWEERWVRDEGYKKIAVQAIQHTLSRLGIAGDAIHHFILPSPFKGLEQEMARACGIPKEAVRDGLRDMVGDTGSAHALLMLCHALDEAKPGQKILMANFAQGCDVLLFETTDEIEMRRPALTIKAQIDGGKLETNYLRYLVFNDLVTFDKGKRAERDKPNALSTMYRRRDMLTALVGGQCRQCGTRQFPQLRICVNPECGAVDSQEPHSFANVPARVMSWSGDYLTYTVDPPLHYGMLTFEHGGRFLAEFTDCEPGDVQNGSMVDMVFRIKDFDTQRKFRRYFWKAVPRRGAVQGDDGREL